jgi:hypothetical protein
MDILREYNLCKKFKCLPSDLEKEDAVKIEQFEIIIDQEARELKKQQDEMRAKSLANIKKI